MGHDHRHPPLAGRGVHFAAGPSRHPPSPPSRNRHVRERGGEGGSARSGERLTGASQIGCTIISITFSLIAVFIPLLFMSGIIGRLFREFAVTVSVAVVASAVISLTLTPVMCSLFLKGHNEQPPGRLSQLCERGFQATLRGYDRGLKFVFRHQFATLVTTLILMAATGMLYMKIPKGFFPQQDTGFIFGQAEGRQDISFYKMSGL